MGDDKEENEEFVDNQKRLRLEIIKMEKPES